ncbi:UNVERIFIED_CONTAM: hypothetical protein FKN15_006414 [Acipenser sinensis]
MMVGEWQAQMQAMLKAQIWSVEQQCDFVIWGNGRQKPGEADRAFTLRLLELLQRLKQQDPDAFVDTDWILKDQFLLGLREGGLHQEVRRQLPAAKKVDWKKALREEIHDLGKALSRGLRPVYAPPALPPLTLGYRPQEAPEQVRVQDETPEVLLSLTKKRKFCAVLKERLGEDHQCVIESEYPDRIALLFCQTLSHRCHSRDGNRTKSGNVSQGDECTKNCLL